MTKRRSSVLAVALATLVLAPAAAWANGDPRDSAWGLGTATSPGITKYFEFAAVQTNPATLAARGEAVLIQNDTTGLYGNFALAGRVVCLDVVGNYATIGLIIGRGNGTAAGHAGEAFYVFVQDNSVLHIHDRLDNSGYTGTSVADCSIVGGLGQEVTKGNIVVDDD